MIGAIHWMYIPEIRSRWENAWPRWALNKTYGMCHVLPSGPLFRQADFREGAVYIIFDYGEGLRSSDGQSLCTFEVAETDGVYYPAVAEVEEGRTCGQKRDG